jgi:dihydroflavonol-4-reductase
MTFRDFFGRLERLTGISAPRVALPSRVNVAGAQLLEELSGWRGTEAPIDPHSVEMGERYWYCDSAKAEAELGFRARDPQDTLFETVRWLDAHVRGKARPTTLAELSRR